ncbi:DUF2975 domain-containing protein [Nocardioides sp. URHA0020]|uniref:DUF2975 domain-containing protein n=1 Tax=Nocardioides sp. URHA0020 TaxID=1380392 RepID=UPI00048CCD75|nr:DUF2975 domain-containing protein [Nocardioides sp. URHA0020]
MLPEQRAVVPLKACLVLLFAILLVFQFMSLPGQFRHLAQESPADAHLRWPLTLLAGFLVLCVQVVVVATWRLLGLVAADRIFTRRSLVWVDVIVAAVAAGWLVLCGLFLWVGFHADDPGVPLLLFLLLVAGAVVGLLMVVMRALLRQATVLRADMDVVI